MASAWQWLWKVLARLAEKSLCPFYERKQQSDPMLSPIVNITSHTSSLKSRLEALKSTAAELMKIGGTPGAAIAIVDQGQLVHSEFLGYRDVDKAVAIDDCTIFPCASLTKAVVSAAVATCVEDGKFSWDTLIKEILPNFRTKSEVLRENMTVLDCLTHRAGMQASLYWLGSMNQVLIPREKSMDLINDLKLVKPFRGGYLYNNLGYEIAAHILEKTTQSPWESTLHSRIFEPLGMTRTGTRALFDDGTNRSKAYETLDDGHVVEIPAMLSGDDTVGGPGSAMRSCIRDLVTLYTAFLDAWDVQPTHQASSSPDSPLKQVPFLFSAKVSMDQVARYETSYAVGWARLQTPGRMGAIGLNPRLLAPQLAPLIGRGIPSELILYHQGSMPGTLAAVNLVPNRRGAIIVLTNSLALNDTADWLGQMYLDEYLNVPEKHDFIKLSEAAVENALKWHQRTHDELEEHRTPGTHPRELESYTGVYRNNASTMMIQVSLTHREGQSALDFAFMGLDSEKFPLTHYQYDEFTWLVSRDDFVRHARFTNDHAEMFKLCFGEDHKDGPIAWLDWLHDKNLAEPERFFKSVPGTDGD